MMKVGRILGMEKVIQVTWKKYWMAGNTNTLLLGENIYKM